MLNGCKYFTSGHITLHWNSYSVSFLMANLISFMPYVSSIPTLTVKLKIVFSIYSASMSIAICISNFNYKPLSTKQPHVHGAAAVWVQEG